MPAAPDEVGKEIPRRRSRKEFQMPTPEEVEKEIVEVLTEVDFEHQYVGSGGKEFLVVWPPRAEGNNGSTVVVIECGQGEGMSVLVSLSSTVLMEIPDEEQTNLKAALIANDLNSIQRMGRWVFYPNKRTFELEYEILGDSLEPNNLGAGITSLAMSGDQYDESLKNELGGKRVIDLPRSPAEE
jgi:hypothetical protein